MASQTLKTSLKPMLFYLLQIYSSFDEDVQYLFYETTLHFLDKNKPLEKRSYLALDFQPRHAFSLPMQKALIHHQHLKIKSISLELSQCLYSYKPMRLLSHFELDFLI